MAEKILPPTGFNLDNYAGERASKFNDLAHYEIMTARQFDGFIGFILDERLYKQPPLPKRDEDDETPRPISEAFALGWENALQYVREMLETESADPLRWMEEEAKKRWLDEHKKEDA